MASKREMVQAAGDGNAFQGRQIDVIDAVLVYHSIIYTSFNVVIDDMIPRPQYFDESIKLKRNNCTVFL